VVSGELYVDLVYVWWRRRRPIVEEMRKEDEKGR